jgi:hypothetical protein
MHSAHVYTGIFPQRPYVRGVPLATTDNGIYSTFHSLIVRVSVEKFTPMRTIVRPSVR